MLLGVIWCSHVFAVSDTACLITIDGNVLDLDGKTFKVPLSMVGIAPQIGYQAPDITALNAQRATPAIVFLIDDSGSMMQNDNDANRYAVTREILDEIYATEPKTRVAVVTFRNWLAWDWRENPLFRKISSPFEWNDSYFPLTPLDSVFSDGKRGIDKIKGLFELDQWNLLQAFHSDSTERTRPQLYDVQGSPIPSTQSSQGTDITLAFTAAKDALRETSTPPERQFIVFLSDGYHGGVDVEMESKKLDYIEGKDVPATYTIFLGDSVKAPPQQLLTMIGNIRNNGYSSTNPRSELWSIASSHDTLLALMQREILSQVYAPLKMANHAQVSGSSAVTITESELTFQKPVALAPESTVVELELTFPLEDKGSGKTRDTLITTRVTFVRDGSVSSLGDSSLGEQCYLRHIAISSNGFPILSSIRNAQKSITAEFTLEGIGAGISQSAAVYSLVAADSLPLGLTAKDGTFNGTFHQVAAESAVNDDDTLQHATGDSLKLVWRNTDLPLDTISRVYRISPYDPVVITGVWYRDTDRDGRIDEVTVETDRAINEQEFDNLGGDRLQLPAARQLTVDSVSRVDGNRGFIIHVTQDAAATPSTGFYAADSLAVNDYETGPFADYIEKGRYPIRDGVAPVIISAQFTAGKEGDTLKVQFSEQVEEISSGYPFKLTTANDQFYSMRLEVIGTDSQASTVLFRVVSTTAPGEKPMAGDSIWVATSTELSDSAGNVQVEPNRKVALNINVPEPDFIVSALRNPVHRSTGKTDFSVPGWGVVKGGTLIAVVPDFPVNDITSVVEKVKVQVYDAVGNLLAYNPENKPDGNRWFIHWDGTNRNKRNVGNGTYCAVITMDVMNNGKKSNVVKQVKVTFR